jgi:hypothetical protein
VTLIGDVWLAGQHTHGAHDVDDSAYREVYERLRETASLPQLDDERGNSGQTSLLRKGELEATIYDVASLLFRPHLVDELGAECFGHHLSFFQGLVGVVEHHDLGEWGFVGATHAAVEIDAVVDRREHGIEDRTGDARRKRAFGIART